MANQLSEETGLRDGLPVSLSRPGEGPIGGNCQQRQLLIKGLGYCGTQVECGRTGSAAYRDGAVEGLNDPQGEEAGTSLVDHAVAGEVAVAGKRMDQRSIA